MDPSYAALSSRRPLVGDGDWARDESKLIAFYLPQFHRIEENSRWWGPGFTEWTNVARAKPNFEGHQQPHIPRELGFYDLTHPRTMAEQVELASLYGIHGFCFYYYWFSGRRLLETPVDRFLASDIDFHFCLCWANENWTRTWRGDEKDVLVEQRYEPDDAARLAESVIPFLRDRRCIRVGGRPLFLIYRIKEVPQPAAFIARLRASVRQAGLGELYVALVEFFDVDEPTEFGADALVEFPPHKFNGPQSRPDRDPPGLDPDFKGILVDYVKVAAQGIAKSPPGFPYFRGLVPGWDNTARRQHTSTIMLNASPRLYALWLEYLRGYTRAMPADEQVIFVNAWNEWAEGCHLEPDLHNGLAYLEATYRTSFYQPPLSPARPASAAFIERLAAEASAEQPAAPAYDPLPLSEVREFRSRRTRVRDWLKRYPLAFSACRALYQAVKRATSSAHSRDRRPLR